MTKALNPNIWGPLLWQILYDLCWDFDSLTDPELVVEIEIRLGALLDSMRYILPCSVCRTSYGVYYDEMPFPGESTASEWIWDLKNKVNRKLTVPQKCQLPFEDFVTRMELVTTMSSPSTVWDILFMFASRCPSGDAARCRALGTWARDLVAVLRVRGRERQNCATRALISALSSGSGPPTDGRFVLGWLVDRKRAFDVRTQASCV